MANSSFEMPLLLEVTCENIILAQRENHILISEELWLCKNFKSPITVNIAYLFSDQPIYNTINSYLTCLNFLGHDMKGDFIIKEILKKIKGLENDYDLCLKIVKFNPYILSSILSHLLPFHSKNPTPPFFLVFPFDPLGARETSSFESELKSPEGFMYLQNIFYTIFISFGLQKASYIYTQLQIWPLSPQIFTCIHKAFVSVPTPLAF